MRSSVAGDSYKYCMVQQFYMEFNFAVKLNPQTGWKSTNYHHDIEYKTGLL